MPEMNDRNRVYGKRKLNDMEKKTKRYEFKEVINSSKVLFKY